MKSIHWIVISLILIGVIFLQRINCNGQSSDIPKNDTTSLVRDTIWKHYDTVIKKPVTIVKTIHDTLPPEYYPDPMYDSLKVQYEELAKDFLAKKIYSDTFKVDEIKGQFVISDTVKNNTLLGRSWSAAYDIPKTTETVTITKYAEPKHEFYAGAGVSANTTKFGIAQVGILYKDRQDRIIGTFIALVPNGRVSYGVQTYWKIKFKK